MKCERLKQFRQETYQMLGKAKNATFELMQGKRTLFLRCLRDKGLSHYLVL